MKNGNNEKIIKKMRQEAKAYNKHLKNDFFDGLGFHGLLNFCHPDSRQDYLKVYKELEGDD